MTSIDFLPDDELTTDTNWLWVLVRILWLPIAIAIGGQLIFIAGMFWIAW